MLRVGPGHSGGKMTSTTVSTNAFATSSVQEARTPLLDFCMGHSEEVLRCPFALQSLVSPCHDRFVGKILAVKAKGGGRCAGGRAESVPAAGGRLPGAVG